eukprot:6821171-Pyramimonas_sp.AAC.2
MAPHSCPVKGRRGLENSQGSPAFFISSWVANICPRTPAIIRMRTTQQLERGSRESADNSQTRTFRIWDGLVFCTTNVYDVLPIVRIWDGLVFCTGVAGTWVIATRVLGVGKQIRWQRAREFDEPSSMHRCGGLLSESWQPDSVRR